MEQVSWELLGSESLLYRGRRGPLPLLRGTSTKAIDLSNPKRDRILAVCLSKILEGTRVELCQGLLY
jgi:hypothetical protein